MVPTLKMQLAAQCLNRRLGVDWEQARLAGAKRRPHCEVRLDRLVVTASGIAEDLILRLPGFHRTKKHFLRQKHPKHFLAYGLQILAISTSANTTSAAAF
jgi:hypothetical protein